MALLPGGAYPTKTFWPKESEAIDGVKKKWKGDAFLVDCEAVDHQTTKHKRTDWTVRTWPSQFVFIDQYWSYLNVVWSNASHSIINCCRNWHNLFSFPMKVIWLSSHITRTWLLRWWFITWVFMSLATSASLSAVCVTGLLDQNTLTPDTVNRYPCG